MTALPLLSDEDRAAVVEAMARATIHRLSDPSTVELKKMAAALTAALPIIERAILSRAADIAEEGSVEVDWQELYATCRDRDAGFHSGRQNAARRIRQATLAEKVVAR